jgi:hypothetical protein
MTLQGYPKDVWLDNVQGNIAIGQDFFGIVVGVLLDGGVFPGAKVVLQGVDQAHLACMRPPSVRLILIGLEIQTRSSSLHDAAAWRNRPGKAYPLRWLLVEIVAIAVTHAVLITRSRSSRAAAVMDPFDGPHCSAESNSSAHQPVESKRPAPISRRWPPKVYPRRSRMIACDTRHVCVFSVPHARKVSRT